MRTMRGLSICFLFLITGVAAAQNNPTWCAGIGFGRNELKTTSVIVLPSEPPQFSTIKESDDLTRIYLAFKPVQYSAFEASLFAGGDFQEIVGESIPGAGDGFKAAADSSGYEFSILGIVPIANRRVDLFVRVGDAS